MFKLGILIILVNTQCILGISPRRHFYVSSEEDSMDKDIQKKEVGKDLLRPITITASEIKVDISNRYATTTYKTSVNNPSNITQESVFFVITPEEAYITAFSMSIDGKDYNATVQEKKKAENLYNNAVNSGWTSAHVSASARNSNKFIVNVNIQANSSVVFMLTHEELLKRRNNNYQQKINLNHKQLVDSLKVIVNIHESSKLKDLQVLPMSSGAAENNGSNVTVSTDIQRPDNVSAVITFNPSVEDQKNYAKSLNTPENEGLTGQFIVVYDVERSENGGEILVEDGYFIHFFAPPNLPVIPKYVIFVVDTSGSMSGRRIEQLQQALKICLKNINPGDVMSIIEFNTDIKIHNLDAPSESTIIKLQEGRNSWMYNSNATIYKEHQMDYNKLAFPPAYPYNEDTMKKAFEAVEGMRAIQSTNIFESLRAALHMAKLTNERTKELEGPERQTIILFCTDGQPTEGLTNTQEIIDEVTNENSLKIPIFTMSFGDGCDKSFLRALSGKNNALSRHIYEASDAALQMESFYKEISSPLLSNVTFKYVDNVTEHTKVIFPVYYYGSEIVVAGRIDEKADVRPRITCGTMPWPRRPWRPQVVNVKSGNIEKSWAYLTTKEYLDKEQNDKALKLALQYKFVTPLTSMVVIKPNSTAEAIDPVEAKADEAAYPSYGRSVGVHKMAKSSRPMMRPMAAAPMGGAPMGPRPVKDKMVKIVSHPIFAKDLMQVSNIAPAKGNSIDYIADEESADGSAVPVTKTNPVVLPSKISTAMPWLQSHITSNGKLDFLQGSYDFGFDRSNATLSNASCTTLLSEKGKCKFLDEADSVYDKIKNDLKFKNYFCVIDKKYIGLCCPN